MRHPAGFLLLLLAALVGCGGDDDERTSAAEAVRTTISGLAPSANLGHRGSGITRRASPYPENSLSSFEAAIASGADGVELDVELTSDGALVVMHDDTLDRTTDCSGCVSDWTLEDVRWCRLLDADGAPTEEVPPVLAEVFEVVPGDALVNVELKVYGDRCRRVGAEPEELARAAAREIRRLGVARRTLFSSFDRTATATLKSENPDLYAGLLYSIPAREHVDWAIDNGIDAIHPLFAVPAADVEVALAGGLQVNIWTVNEADRMLAMIDLGATAIITDEPGLLADVLDDLRSQP